MSVQWATSEELEEYQKRLLEECKETGIIYRKELIRQAEEARTSLNRYIYYAVKHLKSNIHYRGWKINMEPMYAGGIKFTFFGKNGGGGGNLTIKFLNLEDEGVRITTSLIFKYPMATQILETIIYKYDIKNKEEMNSFIDNMVEKRLEFV